MKWRKLKTGNWMGYFGPYYCFMYLRTWGHGAWTSDIGINGEWIAGEGHFTSYLSTLDKAKQWSETKIKQLTA